ncbi:MAG: L-threonylcarbamoyladenylate synthase [Candidatus Methylomirabilia bacterium]
MTVTRVLPVDPWNPDPAALEEAGARVRRGGLVAFPTETFYGLGSNATDTAAVARVFAVKGRPESKPLLALVDSVEMVQSLALEVSAVSQRFMSAYWPGPLTLIFKARPEVPGALTAGTGTMGIRMPGHPVAQGLVRAAGTPVTAPSANLSGGEPPTTAQAVRNAFEGAIDLILDGGPTKGGLPSTILDVSVMPPQLVRRGAVRVTELE